MYEPTIYLASQSQRRKELLTNAGYNPIVIKSEYKENNNENIPPTDLVLKHAEGKAKDVAEKLKEKGTREGLVIGADTIGILYKKVLGKPKNRKNAEKK